MGKSKTFGNFSKILVSDFNFWEAQKLYSIRSIVNFGMSKTLKKNWSSWVNGQLRKLISKLWKLQSLTVGLISVFSRFSYQIKVVSLILTNQRIIVTKFTRSN